MKCPYLSRTFDRLVTRGRNGSISRPLAEPIADADLVFIAAGTGVAGCAPGQSILARRRDRILAQHTAQCLDLAAGQIGQHAILDFIAFAIALAQQDRGRRVSIPGCVRRTWQA